MTVTDHHPQVLISNVNLRSTLYKLALSKGMGQNLLFPSALQREKVCWERFQALPHVRKNRPVCLPTFVSMILFPEQQVKKKSFLKRKYCPFPLRLKVRNLNNQHTSPRRRGRIFSISRQQFSDLPVSVISISAANPSQWRVRSVVSAICPEHGDLCSEQD